MDKPLTKSAWNIGRQIVQMPGTPERQTASSWLAENGVNDKQYYYWLRQIR